MKYRSINGLPSLSLLGFGNMRLPRENGAPNGPIDFPRAREIVRACMENGVNYYDTAFIYHEGNSESFIGRVLSEYPRDSFHIADKYNAWAEPDYRRQFQMQLDRLGMDRIDFYLLHGISDDTVDTYLGNGAIEYFLEEQARGRIGRLGFSFHGRPEVLERVLNHRTWDFVQLQLNDYDWMHGTARRQHELAVAKNLPILVMEPVHGGLLATLPDEAGALLNNAAPDRTAASWAIRFAMGLPNVAVVLSGMSDMMQTVDNLATAAEGRPLDEREGALVEQACAILHKSVAAPCTACRYCCGDCPQGLDIPMLLQMYNEYKLGGAWRLMRLNGLPAEAGPDRCIACGVCTSHCPQQIDIPTLLKEMADDWKPFKTNE